ncbi:MAG: DUF1464 family protein, partial [Isosphaeraceae bacterium]|nr:DUF1464 family protein [Isosphaeraceae bacterium]
MVRVVGTDPGTSSLDLLMLEDGVLAQQARLSPETLRNEPGRLAALLRSWEPIDLVAGPSGYGLPLVRADEFQEAHLELVSLVRAEDRHKETGVVGFRAWVRSLVASTLPVVFLPGGIHLPTIPAHRKVNAIDMGTADKVAVAALALRAHAERFGVGYSDSTFAVVELGSAFSAVLVVDRGRIVDASAGTRGPIGLRSSGAWDGETAYWRSPLAKDDLFRGGLLDLGEVGPAAFRESLTKHVAALRAVTPFDHIYLSGSAAEQPDVAALAGAALAGRGTTAPLPA